MFVYDEAGMPDVFFEIADYYGAHNICILTHGTPKNEFGVTSADYDSRNDTIRIHCNKLWHYAMIDNRRATLSDVWVRLIQTLLHEIGHQNQRWNKARRYFGMSRKSDWHELDAIAFETKELLRLAVLDDQLFMPDREEFPGYFGARAGKQQGMRAELVREGYYGQLVPLYKYMENAGDHVLYDDPRVKHMNLIKHYTPSRRCYRYMTIADTLWWRFLNGFREWYWYRRLS